MRTIERETEIATMALNKLREIDEDMAQRFMLEEIDMDAEEMTFHGAYRIRKATNIEWYSDEDDEPNLPKEVDIPYDVFDDDITDYLEGLFHVDVLNFDIEEEDF